MARDLKLGLNFGYWAGGPPPTALESLKEAEQLGFESCWTAEAYGSDALIPLAWWGSETGRIKLGTAIVQISARTPAATAMAALTLDHLSGGRLILGVGAGWYRRDYDEYGYDFATAADRLRTLERGLEVVKRRWAADGEKRCLLLLRPVGDI